MSCVVAHYAFGIGLKASSKCMWVPRASTLQKRWSTGFSVYWQWVLEGCGSEIQYPFNHDTGYRTNVAMHTATVQEPLTTVSPNCVSILQTVAGFINKPNVVPFRWPCPLFFAPLVAQNKWIPAKDKRSNICFVDISLICMRRRMVRRDTEWCVSDWICFSIVCDVAAWSITSMLTIRLSSREVWNEVSTIRPVGPSFFSASIDYKSKPQMHRFVQHIGRFLWRIISNIYMLLFFLRQIQKLDQKTLDVFHAS